MDSKLIVANNTILQLQREVNRLQEELKKNSNSLSQMRETYAIQEEYILSLETQISKKE